MFTIHPPVIGGCHGLGKEMIQLEASGNGGGLAFRIMRGFRAVV